jgi:hypothetical protein
MKYLKKFEDRELIDSLRDLQNQMSRLKTLVKMDYRDKTPKDIYEDYFLEFKDSEGFKVDIRKNNYAVGPVNIYLYNMIDKKTVESEFYRYVNKLKSIKERLEYKAFTCHFTIKLDGKIQNVQTGYDRRDDDFIFSGLGDHKFGYDGKGNHYNNNQSNYRNTTDKDFPEDKVSIIVDFKII